MAEEVFERVRALLPWPACVLGLHSGRLALRATGERLVGGVRAGGLAGAECMYGRDGLYSVAL